MMNRHFQDSPLSRRLLPIACATALAATLSVALPKQARATVTAPAVPAEIRAPFGTKAILVGHAVGTQNYICLPSASGFAWALFGPQATLLDDTGKQIITHYFSASASEKGAVRATWQRSSDGSLVLAQADPASTDPRFVAQGAVPWLLLRVTAARQGRGGDDAFVTATYVQRVNTSGGVAPTSGCSTQAEIGTKAFVPYTADYVFFSGTDNATY